MRKHCIILTYGLHTAVLSKFRQMWARNSLEVILKGLPTLNYIPD